MHLAHLTKRDNDDGPYLAGTSRYAIAANSLIMLKKCREHEDCYVLIELAGRKGDRSEDSLLTFCGDPSQ